MATALCVQLRKLTIVICVGTQSISSRANATTRARRSATLLSVVRLRSVGPVWQGSRAITALLPAAAMTVAAVPTAATVSCRTTEAIPSARSAPTTGFSTMAAAMLTAAPLQALHRWDEGQTAVSAARPLFQNAAQCQKEKKMGYCGMVWVFCGMGFCYSRKLVMENN